MPATWDLLVAGLLIAQSTPAPPTRPNPSLEPYDHVEVTDGRQTVRGRMTGLTADAVVVQSDRDHVTLPLATVQRIDRVGDSRLNGTAVGAAVGGASALALMAKLCTNNNCSNVSASLDPRFTLFGTLVGAGVGALIDAAIKGRKTVYLAGAGQAPPTIARPTPANPARPPRNGILIFGHGGGVRLSDDEGSLGGGATAGGGVVVPIGPRFGVQVGYDRQRRKREFERNRAFHGTEQVFTIKGLYYFRSTEAIRPYVGFGLAFIDSEQRSVSPTFTLGPGNQVLPGPLETFHSRSLGSGAGFAAGMEARVYARLSVLADLTFDFTDNRPEGLGSARLTLGAGWTF